MIGVILISHGGLAKTLLDTAAEIVGELPQAEALAVSRHEVLDDIEGRISAAIERVDGGAGVLVLADMFGGTATNVALRLVGRHKMEILTACNLPMLLKLSYSRELPLSELAQLLKAYGQKNIRVASDALQEREKNA